MSFYSVVFAIVILCATIKNTEGALRGTQIVAEFPQGVYNGTCDATVLRKLPLKCRQALNDNSPEEQKLACHLIAQPNTIGTIPFGAYPATVSMDTDLADLTSDSVTPIYDACALAQMIDDGCFSFRGEVWGGEHSQYSYATESEFLKSQSQTYGNDFSADVDLFFVSASVSYSSKNTQSSAKSISSKRTGSRLSWRENVGKLTFSTCARSKQVKKYLNQDFVNKWASLAADTKDGPARILMNEYFAELMNAGFFIPTTFGYAVEYAARLDGKYTESSSSSSQSAEETMSSSVSVGFLFFSTSISTTMSSSANTAALSKNLDMSLQGSDYKYGMCDFTGMLANQAENWTPILTDCAKKASTDMLQLDRATYIPRGGFYNIFDMMIEIGLDINTSNLRQAMIQYYSVCSCDAPWDSNNKKFTCRDPTGVVLETGVLDGTCRKAAWWMRDNSKAK